MVLGLSFRDVLTLLPVGVPLFYMAGGNVYQGVRLVFGTLFPAYYSYKAVKTKNVKEYVKWMMYWIVFAFFTCLETLTDLFLSFWFPFYYELKILVVLWLLSPATKGSSILYRKFVHPWLTRKEDDIDDYIAKAKQQSYSTVIQLGSKGVNYATNVLMQTAIKGGGGIVNQLRRSYSSGELAGGDMNRNVKALPNIQDPEYDDHNSSGSYDSEPRRVRADSEGTYKARGSSTSRGSRSTKARSADVTDVYYQDVPDEAVQRRKSPRTQDMASRVLSSDDLTSGYSSGDPDLGEALSCKGPAYDDVDLETNASTATTSTTNTNIHNEPSYTTQRSSRVRRTQSLKVSGPERNTLPRSRRTVAEKKVLEERHSVAGTGGGGGGGWEGGRSGEGWPSSYSSTSAAHQGASSFKRSRPGEISAYATLPRTTSKRAATKKRQV